MKVLLCYQHVHHARMVRKLSDLLKENGVENDALCFCNYELIHNSNDLLVTFICSLFRFLNRINSKKIRNICQPIIPHILMRLLLKRYDKIDFQSYWGDNLNWSYTCYTWGIKYDITVWGSEVLRASDESLLMIEDGYKHANAIRAVDKILDRLSSVYQGRYNQKMIKAYFGNSNYDVIDALEKNKSFSLAQKLRIRVPGKLTVTCGYNGVKEQQHLLILDSISGLSQFHKDQIHLVIPMTYELDNEYLLVIKQKLDSIDVSYTILDSFLSTEELASLRKESDIVINAQTTDAFCGAIQDHLYCGCVLIIADWLDYPQYDNNDVYYIKTSRDKMTSDIEFAITNFDSLKEKTNSNVSKLRTLSSWDSVMKMWVYAAKF